MTLTLVENPDVAATIGQKKKASQVFVGFAAETTNVEDYARKKLAKKNLDFIVANDVSEEGAGFGVETNHVKIFARDGRAWDYPLLPKMELGGIILDHVEKLLKAK